MGLHLLREGATGTLGRWRQAFGRILLRSAPVLMKTLAVVGTAAMFLVGGGILAHGLPFVHHLLEGSSAAARGIPALGGTLAALAPILVNLLTGIVAGGLVLAVVNGVKWLVVRVRR